MQAAAWTESMARQLLSPPTHPEMLGRIGRYEVERLIGSGGMGVVFKAFDTELNRPVAVKALAPHLAGSGAARNRFAREARAAAAVVHDHVVAIHNVESEGASPFLVMPYVAGESLQQRIDREGSLELCEILRIVKQTAAGLAAAHAQGLVHRDVKPSNILLEQGVERALL
ncbi:MAG: protein kinase, partial [Planctomycetaceae bacterium]|nr:protein kinase [Planctomycetaceae bacterium]